MMRLFIQIPCLNEQENLARTLSDLPQKIPGIDEIKTVVVDDGSTDETVRVAKEWGVDFIVSFPRNLGLAKAFANGLNACLMLGADIIVNTDADNQYKGKFIAELVRPILERKAEIVIGCRPIEKTPHFSWVKKKLQRWGSRIVNRLASTRIPDVTTGFRAFTRAAALQLNVISTFTYTVETIIQAGQRQIPMVHIDVETNEQTRESRLFSNIFSYVYRSTVAIVRIFMRYRPLPTFLALAGLSTLAGLVPCIRFLYHALFLADSAGRVQSLILGAILLIFGAAFALMGVLGDQTAAHTQLTEEVLFRMRKLAFAQSSETPDVPNLIYRRQHTRN
jgi:glycosyltransferase involved in cell wall biosynthesis